MMYEYKILRTESPTASEEQLDGFGSEGWELCTIIPWMRAFYYYFKRLKTQSLS